MPTVSTHFKVPCAQDRAILAIQDFVNSAQWQVLELSTSRVVLKGPGVNQMQYAGFPIITLELKEIVDETVIGISVSSIALGQKKHIAGIMGQVINGISVRVQTKSLAINPTVALGEGQGETQSEIPSPSTDRIGQLERLQKLLESGVLTREEFDAEKQKILREN
jgi:hypothetical protein